MIQSATPSQTPPLLVGREREQAVLRDHLAAALAGQGSLVLIGGEAGIGKTALAEALCHEATAQGALVLIGRCYDLTETPPYGPWVELFDQYHQHGELPRLPASFAIRGTVGEVISQSVLFQQVLTFFAALAAVRPVTVLLDDLHWADSASLDLLRFLARSLARHPLLLLVTYRTDELTRRHPLYQLLPVLVREASAARLTVRPLTPEGTAALLRDRFALPDADTARLVSYLNERGEGNPFFIGELIQALEEEGALRQESGAWSLGELAGAQVPPLLRQVIDGRLARLGDETQGLLAVAAVIGQGVPLDIWAAVTGNDEAILLETVEQATTAHLVDATADGTGFRFAHALIREALYEGLSPPRRRAWHRQVGEALVATSTPDPDAVAYHFQRANDVQATAWLIRAGERALALFAERAAVLRFEAALASLETHEPGSAERGWVLNDAAGAYRFIDPPRAVNYAAEAMRAAERTGDRPLTLGSLRLRGWLHNDAGRMAAGLDDMLAARALMDVLTDVEWTATRERRYTAVPNLLFDAALTEYLAFCGEFDRARELGERFAAGLPDGEAETTGLSPDIAMAIGNCHFGLLCVYLYQGEPARAARAAARARAGYNGIGWVRMVGHVARTECLSALTYAADRPGEWRRLAGEWDMLNVDMSPADDGQASRQGRALVLAAEGRWDEARSAAAATSDDRRPLTRHAAWLLVAGLDRACGEMETAWESVRAVLPEGPTGALVRQYRVQEPALRLGAELALDGHDLPSAALWLGAYDALLARSTAVLGRSEGQALWAQYHRQSRDMDTAREHAGRALAHATEPRQPLALLAGQRLLGELDTEVGRDDDAARHLDASLSLADACEMPYERALTLLARADLHAATGDTEAARTALGEAKTICEWLGAKPALARADALAVHLTLTPTATVSYPDGRSAREVEVLRLIATGINNQEIADSLSLSVRTVERHITNLYAKIDARGRADATTYALHHLP